MTPAARRLPIRFAARAGVVTRARLRLVPAPVGLGRCMKDGDGGQVREDLIFTDVGVLRPGQLGAGGAGVAVTAPVGGLAIGPG